MNTTRNATRRIQEEIDNVGAPLNGYNVPPVYENSNVDQSPTNSPPMTEAAIRDILAQVS